MWIFPFSKLPILILTFISFLYAEICTNELIVSGSYFPIAGLSDLSCWGWGGVSFQFLGKCLSLLWTFLCALDKCANSDITSTNLCFIFLWDCNYSSSDPWRCNALCHTPRPVGRLSGPFGIDNSCYSPLYLGSSIPSPRHQVHGHHQHLAEVVKNPAI